jgi:UDP-glucuronate decarboxylase
MPPILKIRTLITGGSGFLGSHLCEKLLEHKAKQRKPDITLAKEELDWEPKIKLEDGLVKTIGYFERLLSSE